MAKCVLGVSLYPMSGSCLIDSCKHCDDFRILMPIDHGEFRFRSYRRWEIDY